MGLFTVSAADVMGEKGKEGRGGGGEEDNSSSVEIPIQIARMRAQTAHHYTTKILHDERGRGRLSLYYPLFTSSP